MTLSTQKTNKIQNTYKIQTKPLHKILKGIDLTFLSANESSLDNFSLLYDHYNLNNNANAAFVDLVIEYSRDVLRALFNI